MYTITCRQEVLVKQTSELLFLTASEAACLLRHYGYGVLSVSPSLWPSLFTYRYRICQVEIAKAAIRVVDG